MKKYAIFGMSLCIALAFVSCKSQQSAYKKAYEQAKQQASIEAKQNVEPQTTPVEVAPVQQATTTTTTSDVAVRSEKVQLIDGSGIKEYSVVCGSFSLKANAEGLQKTLKSKGYAAQIAYNPSNKMYRVIASTSSDKSSAVQSRNELRSSYPDAWLLYNN